LNHLAFVEKVVSLQLPCGHFFSSRRMLFLRPADKNYFRGLEIYFSGFEIYFSALEIYFRTTEKVLCREPKENIHDDAKDYIAACRKNNVGV